MAKNNRSQNQQEQKVVTKYDKKVQKRKEAQRKAERDKKITVFACIAAAAAIIVIAVCVAVSNYTKVHKKFIEVDNTPVSQIEFDFYYGVAKSDLLNSSLYGTMTYASYFTSYMGYDTGKSDASQKYASSDNTWYDYFANTAVTKIKEFKALNKAADDAGFTYNTLEDDYNSFIENIASEADSNSISVGEAYKELFGSHATESSIKPYVEKYLKAAAYQEELQTTLAATDDEVAAYYAENKDNYDTVDYRSFTITAETSGDTAVHRRDFHVAVFTASLAAAKTKADAMAAAVTDEASFAQACTQYAATDEDKEKYADETASLSKSAKKSSVTNSSLADWLFTQDRKAGEVTVIEDTDNSAYIVAYFISRSYDESNNTTIANQLLSQKYNELITGYTDNIKNRIKMLSE